MAILAGRLKNVYQSIDEYLTSNLVDTQGSPLSLRLHGVRRFVPPAEAPWIEAHYDFLGLNSQYLGLAGRDVPGPRRQQVASERTGYLQLNLYQRARLFAQRYTTAAVRDIVVDAFPDGGILPIYAWDDVTQSGGEPVQEASLIMDGVKEHVADTGIQSGLTQHIVQVAMRYWERYTRA